MSNFDTSKWFKNQYIKEHLINESISLSLKDLTFDDVVNAFDDNYKDVQFTRKQSDGEEGNYYRDSVGFPNPDDSLTRIGDLSSFESWKDKTLSRYGNVQINLSPESDEWFNKVKVLDDKFNKDKEDYGIAKGKALDQWRKTSNYGLDENLKDYIKISEPSFRKDKNNPNFLSAYIKYDTGGGASMALGKETMSGQIRRLSSAEAVRQMDNIAKKLNDSFDIEDIEVTDLENGVVELFAVSDDFIDMDPRSELSMALLEIDINDPVLVRTRADKAKMDKLEKDQEQKIQNLKRTGAKETPLRKLANMGKIAFLEKEREQLMRDMEQEAEPEGGPIADEYGRKLNRIDQSIAKLKGRKEMTYSQAIAEGHSLEDKDIEVLKDAFNILFVKHPDWKGNSDFRRIIQNLIDTNDVSGIKEIVETIKLGEGMIEEELCAKGKAYRKRRMAAGEKSSAYLSGRAVKVCKGQMSGTKKKKKK